jgi:hypothetical protein
VAATPRKLARKEPHMSCLTCPSPDNCGPAFCAFNDAELTTGLEFDPTLPPVTPKDFADEAFYRPDYGRPYPIDPPQISFPDARAWLGDMLYAAVPVVAFVGVVGLFVGFLAVYWGWL